MTDARTKQPAKLFLELDSLRGGHGWYALLETWTYHGLKNEDVFAREMTVKFWAEDFRAATGIATALATVISCAHDVHQCSIRLVANDRFYKGEVE